MVRRARHALEYWFRRRRLEDELDEELRSSFEMVVDGLTAQGMTPAAARRAARIEFEGLEQVKERVRDRLLGSATHTVLLDVWYAWRGLWRRRSFAAVALLTLALGIGVNTAVFSVFYSVLLRPLPYADSARLVMIWAGMGAAGKSRGVVSGTLLGEIERRNRALADVAGIWVGSETFTGEHPEQVRLAQVTPNFFDVLGVRAAVGRTFVKEEAAGERTAMVLSDGLFRRRFAANAGWLGKGVPTQHDAMTPVGVLPASFQLYFAPEANVPADVEAFIPFPYDIYSGPKRLYFIRVVGRLKRGVSMAEAQRDLDRVAAETRGAYTEFAAAKVRFSVTGMQADAVRDIQPALQALFAGAAFVLLICCVNITSLLLARASERRREIGLRLALGASRGRIVRQLFIEGGLLCVLGGAGGVAVAWAAFRGVMAIRPERLAGIDGAGLSWPALAFAAAVSMVAALIFGLAPATEAFRFDLVTTLRAKRLGWMGRLHRRAGGALVIAEIAMGFVLVTGAALAARTLAQIEQVRPGFDARQLLTFQVAFGPGTLNPAVPLSTIAEWDAQLAAMPRVESVGATSHLPLDDFPNWFGAYRPEGVAPENAAPFAASGMSADSRCVTPGYFAAMGTRLVEGRYFDGQDRAGGRQVVIVDELLARSAWPGQSAVGKRIEASHVTRGGLGLVPSVVVGVVEHMRNHSVTKEVRPEIYVPFEQSPRSPLTWVVRTRVSPLSLVPAIREMLSRRDPNVAMAKVRTMDDYVARDIAPAGFTAVLAAVFGGLALVLAATGIYEVLNYQVSRRMPEMGIRMAVGARGRDVVRLVLGEGLGLAGPGVVLGVAGALVVSRWVGGLLYGVSALDPWSYGLALVLLPGAAMLGCWRPARRAAGANPADVVREE